MIQQVQYYLPRNKIVQIFLKFGLTLKQKALDHIQNYIYNTTSNPHQQKSILQRLAQKIDHQSKNKIINQQILLEGILQTENKNLTNQALLKTLVILEPSQYLFNQETLNMKKVLGLPQDKTNMYRNRLINFSNKVNLDMIKHTYNSYYIDIGIIFNKNEQLFFQSLKNQFKIDIGQAQLDYGYLLEGNIYIVVGYFTISYIFKVKLFLQPYNKISEFDCNKSNFYKKKLKSISYDLFQKFHKTNIQDILNKIPLEIQQTKNIFTYRGLEPTIMIFPNVSFNKDNQAMIAKIEQTLNPSFVFILTAAQKNGSFQVSFKVPHFIIPHPHLRGPCILPKFIINNSFEFKGFLKTLFNPAHISCAQKEIIFLNIFDLSRQIVKRSLLNKNKQNIQFKLINQKVAQTVIGQGHLSPIQIISQPIYWNLDKYLMIQEPPRFLVISDIYSDPYLIQLQVKNKPITVIFPGDFSSHKSFAVLYPKSQKVQLCEL